MNSNVQLTDDCNGSLSLKRLLHHSFRLKYDYFLQKIKMAT
ncbi:MAG: hypothetical protein ACI9DO_000597, partial [Reinekea sp.]